jgi:Ca-activated chloride channel family protein
MIRFVNPHAFWLLILIVPIVFVSLKGRRRQRTIGYSTLDFFAEAGLEAPRWKQYGKLALRVMILALVVSGIARPQTGQTQSRVMTEGIDIMLVLDTSSSMAAEDFKPKHRLHVSKEVVKDFIARRRQDRIGLVVFSAQAITQCPLTLDYSILETLVDQVGFGMLEDGTAIGVALATACNRMKDSGAKSRIVVLLTDGQNNTGTVDPVTAARVAKSLGIKVYTIGVGTTGVVPVPVDDPLFGRRRVPMEVKLDEVTLKEMATITDGEYFRATDRDQLETIYERIDALERTDIEAETYTSYTDRFYLFVLPALILLAAELWLAESVLREIP